MVKIELYYDCLSPFSFFAFTTLCRYEKIWGVDLDLKPLLLGGVMASTKNMPPGVRPWSAATASIGAQDMQRNIEWFNVPHMLSGPANFFGPQGPADPSGLARDFRYQRTLTCIKRLHPKKRDVLREASRLVFEQIWASKTARDEQGKVEMNEAVLLRICEQAGLSKAEAAAAMKEIGSDENKALLKSTVHEAVSRGAHGAPTIVVSGVEGRDEMVFFGSDRFEQLAFVSKLPWKGPDPSRPTVMAKL